MDRKRFLVTMSAAVLMTAILVWLARPGQKTPDRASSVPPVAQSAPDTARVTIQPGSCTATACRFSPLLTAAFDLTSEGRRVLGTWNVLLSSQTVLTLENVSPDPVTVSGMRLSVCLNDAIVPIEQVPPECQFVKISQTDYNGGTLVVKPRETISVTLDTDTHQQTARLEFDTTRGPIMLMVIAQ